LLPSLSPLPWQSLGQHVHVHLGLFVHRVEGLTPGIYALIRDPLRLESVKSRMRKSFLWTKPPECPRGLPLYLLIGGDQRELASRLSCHQEIAADGAFCCVMLAEFEQPLLTDGPFRYRFLHWEAGMIGQLLYLEAESAGLRGTGMGCFFDDPAGGSFGLKGIAMQSLYQFTLGNPIEDSRISTAPAYRRE
jgi:hypothetical protein